MNTRALEQAMKLKTQLDKLPTHDVLVALRRPWYQILGGATRRAAAAQVLGERPDDKATVIPALCIGLGDNAKQVTSDAAEALCSIMRKTTPSAGDVKAIAESAAAALQRNLWGMATPMLLQLMARCGAASAPHIPRVEMSLRYVHLSQPPFIGRLHSLWGNCALILAGTTSPEPSRQIGEIVAQYTKRLTQSPAEQIGELAKALGPNAGALAVAGAAFSDTVSDFGFDFMLLDALEVLGEKAEPLRQSLKTLSAAFTDDKAKQRIQAILGRLDRPSGSATPSQSPEQPQSNPKYFTFEGEIALPPGVREKAVVLMGQGTAEQNHKALGSHVLSERWEDAFPFALAEVMQSGSPVAMKYVGACLLKTVERHAAAGAVSPTDKDYIAGAIRCLTEAIEHGDSDWDAYQYRGASRLIAAQLNRDRTALDSAERDFRESKRINPTPMVDRNLAALQGVRQKMF